MILCKLIGSEKYIKGDYVKSHSLALLQGVKSPFVC